MATKKQKRAAALAKREAFEAEIRESGLAALARAKEHEKRVRASYAEAGAQINERHEEILSREAEKSKSSRRDELDATNELVKAVYGVDVTQ